MFCRFVSLGCVILPVRCILSASCAYAGGFRLQAVFHHPSIVELARREEEEYQRSKNLADQGRLVSSWRSRPSSTASAGVRKGLRRPGSDLLWPSEETRPEVSDDAQDSATMDLTRESSRCWVHQNLVSFACSLRWPACALAYLEGYVILVLTRLAFRTHLVCWLGAQHCSGRSPAASLLSGRKSKSRCSG
jgi:hypothetical protein